MAFDTPLTKTENYVFGRGVGYFAEFDENGVPMGERDLGNMPGLNLTVTSETLEHYSSRSGLRKKDRSTVTGVGFDATLTIEDFSAENQALFIAGSVATVTQAATPVSNYQILNARSGRHYQLGAQTNTTGVRGVTSVTVGLYELVNAAARADSTAYTVGQIYKVSSNVFLVTTAGTSAGSPPSMVTTSIGATTTDGTAVVKYLGTTGNFTVTTDYLLSAESARIGIVAGGNIALACNLYELTVPGSYLSLNVGYTPAANTRQQISSSGSGVVTGQFRYIADNAEGTNRDLFIASCSLAPEGDFPLITESEYAQCTFTLGVNERDTSTAQIIIDGRPV